MFRVHHAIKSWGDFTSLLCRSGLVWTFLTTAMAPAFWPGWSAALYRILCGPPCYPVSLWTSGRPTTSTCSVKACWWLSPRSCPGAQSLSGPGWWEPWRSWSPLAGSTSPFHLSTWIIFPCWIWGGFHVSSACRSSCSESSSCSVGPAAHTGCQQMAGHKFAGYMPMLWGRWWTPCEPSCLFCHLALRPWLPHLKHKQEETRIHPALQAKLLKCQKTPEQRQEPLLWNQKTHKRKWWQSLARKSFLFSVNSSAMFSTSR